MKEFPYKIIILFISILTITSLNIISNLNYSYSNVVNEDLERREMLINTANAYERKKENYQYDLYRENKFTAPEEINSYNKSYAVCSTFVFQVYYNTLGIRIPILSKNHLNNASKLNENNTNKYIRYYTKDEIKQLSGDTAKDKIETFEKNMSYFLEKGDIVTIGYGSNGHTLMVHDVIQGQKVNVIHNNGFVYDYKTKEEKYENETNAIQIERLSDVIKASFINNNDFTFNAISFIKIIADGKYLSFSNSTVKQLQFPSNDLLNSGKTRYKYKNMDVEKTYTIKNNDCSTTKSLYANLNSEITYKITIKNNSDKSYSGMKITENIDTNKVEFISSSKGTYKDGIVTFSNINVNSQETINLTYTVKVKNAPNNIYTQTISTGKIDDTLNLKTINVNIGNTLSEYQKNIILSNYSKVSASNSKEYIKKLYKNYLKFDIDFHEFITYENNTNHLVKNTKTNDNQNIILSNLYGLEIGASDNPDENIISIYNAWNYWSSDNVVTTDPNLLGEYKNRIRTINYNMLETGDIILTNETAYLYIIENNEPKLILNGSKYNIETIDEFLKNLIGKKYTILRPSLNKDFAKKEYTITFVSNEKDTTNIPNKMSYVYSTIEGCKFPISSQIPKKEGYTFKGWMLDSNNTLIFQPGINWKQSNQRDYTLIATWEKNSNDDTTTPDNSQPENNPSQDKPPQVYEPKDNDPEVEPPENNIPEIEIPEVNNPENNKPESNDSTTNNNQSENIPSNDNNKTENEDNTTKDDNNTFEEKNENIEEQNKQESTSKNIIGKILVGLIATIVITILFILIKKNKKI